MAGGAQTHVADLMALIAEIHRNPDKRGTPFEGADFNPYREKPARPPPPKENITILKGIFCPSEPLGNEVRTSVLNPNP